MAAGSTGEIATSKTEATTASETAAQGEYWWHVAMLANFRSVSSALIKSLETGHFTKDTNTRDLLRDLIITINDLAARSSDPEPRPKL